MARVGGAVWARAMMVVWRRAKASALAPNRDGAVVSVAGRIMALPDFPPSVDPVRRQRVVDAMSESGLLPARDRSFRVNTMTG
ncbi:MAG TPA: hypothetical protein VHW06_08105 [Streptosporangiaceae bacterium]|nr:hypothetical protein [Streptosporangiaceae bacterium]